MHSKVASLMISFISDLLASQGVDELDPSGRLSRKVQRLSDLTSGLQLAREKRSPTPQGQRINHASAAEVG